MRTGGNPKSYLISILNFGYDLKVIAIQVGITSFLVSELWSQSPSNFFSSKYPRSKSRSTLKKKITVRSIYFAKKKKTEKKLKTIENRGGNRKQRGEKRRKKTD